METSSATQEVIQDQDAQAAKALAECDSLLSNAASDVGNLCQGLYDTFPCLEDSVPAIEGPQAAYTLEPAGMLELQVLSHNTSLHRPAKCRPHHLQAACASPEVHLICGWRALTERSGLAKCTARTSVLFLKNKIGWPCLCQL